MTVTKQTQEAIRQAADQCRCTEDEMAEHLLTFARAVIAAAHIEEKGFSMASELLWFMSHGAAEPLSLYDFWVKKARDLMGGTK